MCAKVDCLHITPGAEIPEVEAVSVLVGEQIFRNEPVLKLRQQPHSLVTI
jgi:hypothetical protein